VNSRRSPSLIFCDHAEDQVPNCLGKSLPADWPAHLEINFQYKRKPARCQPTTVSGVTTINEFFHADQSRWAVTQNNLSRTLSLGRIALIWPKFQN
jgi:hypothetical protein